MVGKSAADCAAGATGVICTESVAIVAAATATVAAYGYGNTSGSGTPLEIGAAIAVAMQSGHNNQSAMTPGGRGLEHRHRREVAAGVASAVSVTVTATDAAGVAIPAAATGLLNADGSALFITLQNSEGSDSTILAASTYAGGAVALNYDGNLPLPNPITIRARTQGGVTSISGTPVAVVQSTASKSFTFSFCTTTTVVQNKTAVPTHVDNAGEMPFPTRRSPSSIWGSIRSFPGATAPGQS